MRSSELANGLILIVTYIHLVILCSKRERIIYSTD